MDFEYLKKTFIFFPFLILFYFSMIQSLKVAKLEKYNFIVNILFLIQITTHIFFVINNSYDVCNPNKNDLCNSFAELIGLVYLVLIIMCFKNKSNMFTYISLVVVFYIILSHFVTIYPAEGAFLYNKLKLPIFHMNSYIIPISDTFHENKLKKELHSLIEPGDAVIDAGAYVGDTSLILAKEFPSSFVYAVEPSKYNYGYINKIKKDNKLDNLTVFNILLSDSEQNYTGVDINKPNATYTASSSGDGLKSYTLDSLVANGSIPHKIKVLHYDVEGMELPVLKGSENTIKKYKPYIVIEMLYKENPEIMGYLASLGYSYKIVDESCCFGDFNDSKKCRNYIFYSRNPTGN
uniref:Methyltransferase FkbM domain-containing protein n=1 Tax=viral metagenome TaxID=1070528 RepID=A0A6C0AY61_9ZZZZ